MTTFTSKIKTGIKKIFVFIKSNILIIIFIGIVIYQNDRINELEKDLGEGFAFQSTTDIVDRLSDEVDTLKGKTDDIRSETENTTSLSDDLDSRIEDIESNISNMESDIRRLKSNFY